MVPRDKAGKFKELAEKRVTRAIKTLRLISNLADKKNYEYSHEQVEKLLSVLNTELRNLKRRFHENQTDEEPIFRL